MTWAQHHNTRVKTKNPRAKTLCASSLPFFLNFVMLKFLKTSYKPTRVSPENNSSQTPFSPVLLRVNPTSTRVHCFFPKSTISSRCTQHTCARAQSSDELWSTSPPSTHQWWTPRASWSPRNSERRRTRNMAYPSKLEQNLID